MQSVINAETLTRLASELQAEPTEALTVRAILENALQMIADAEMASLTVRARKGSFATLGSTSPIADVLDEAQYSLGEGPCVDSTEEGDWFRSSDLARESRWPAWSSIAVEQGVRSMLSVHLDSDGKPFGAINLYSGKEGSFGDREEIELALLYAAHAANALSAARLVSGLETAIGTRHEIGMAQGILIERYGLTVDQSFSFLQRLSQNLNRKLRDVAHEIVDTRAVPELPNHDEPS